MKRLKLSLFSLLAMLAFSIFVSSCEKADEAELLTEEPTESHYFTLPQEFDEMSEEDMTSHLERMTQEELENIGTEIKAEEVEARSCGNWATICYFNAPSWYCSAGCRKARLKRRWCGPPGNGGYQYRVYYYNCC